MSDAAGPTPSLDLTGVRFETTPYKADGGFGAGGSGLLIVVSMAAGAAAGFAASFISQWFYLVLLFPLAIGALLGFIGKGMIRVGKVRSPLLGGVAGLFGGIVAMLGMHFFDYQRFDREFEAQLAEENVGVDIVKAVRGLAERKAKGEVLPERAEQFWQNMQKENPVLIDAVQVHDFISYLNFEAKQGVELQPGAGRGGQGMNLGYYGTIIYWCAEALIVAFVAFFMMKSAAGEPFCTECESWKSVQRIGSLRSASESSIAGLREGDFKQLLTGQPTVEMGEFQVTTATCAICNTASPMDVKLEQVTKNAKGQEQRKELLHVTYPGEAWPMLTAVFQGVGIGGDVAEKDVDAGAL